LPFVHSISRTLVYQVIDTKKTFNVYGRNAVVDNCAEYVPKLMEISQPLWELVKTKEVCGNTAWAYFSENRIFSGLQLDTPPSESHGLEERNIELSSYAYYKHVGPYEQIRSICEEIVADLSAKGHKNVAEGETPFIVECYGEWNEDPSKLETEIHFTLA
jgi:predicted transcriptional regulator YdeE